MTFVPLELNSADAVYGELGPQVRKAGLVLIRDSRLDVPEFVRLVESLGPMDRPWDATGVTSADSRVQDMRVEGGDQAHVSSADYWHSDQSFAVRPPGFTVLYCVKAPRRGGGTQFCSSRLSTLPSSQAPISSQRAWVRHSYRETLAVLFRGRRDAGQLKTFDEEYPDVWHPLIRKQPGTDAPMLFLSPLTARAIRIGDDESEIASNETFEHLLRAATENSRVYTHTWKPGDVLVWDNSAAMHRREAGVVEGDRIHWRAVTGGLDVIAA